MAVIALASASGAPGVTTTAVGLALLWPRPVLLIEADPSGSSAILAGYFRGAREYDGGLIELAYSPTEVAESLPSVVRPIQGSNASLVAGIRTPAQAGALRDMWGPLADALAALEEAGQDVIVDAGRLGMVGSPEPVLASADVTVLVTRSSLPSLAAAKSRSELMGKAHAWHCPATVLVGEGQPYRAHEVSRVLGLPVLSTVADDVTAAAVFAHGETPRRGFDGGALVRTLRATISSLQAQVARNSAALLAEAPR